MKKRNSNWEILKSMGVFDTDFDFDLDLSPGARHPAPPENDQQLLLTVEQAKRRLGIGRSHLYNVLGRGEIQSVKIGRSRRIPLAALDRYIERMQEDEEEM